MKQQQKPSRRPIFSQEAHVASFPRGEDSDSLGSEQQQFSVYPQQRRQQSVPVDRVDRRSDGQLISANAQRVATAGRVGTQRHVNPCKVYLGNLSFQVSSKQVQEWIVDIMGLPAHIVLASSNKGCHIVTDWKTGKSKGYGFVVFSEPMYATVALETLNNRLWHNRTVTASPGIPHESLAHKAMLQERFDSKQAKRLAAAEKAAKTNASTPIPVVVYMDAHEASMLARLDPDLLQGVTIRKEAKDTTIRTDDKDHLTAVLGKDQDQSKSRTETNNQLPQMESLELNVELEDDEDDDGDYDDDYDDECDDVDDDLLEWETRIEAQSGESKESAIESPMNREQRREADKRTPRRKKESKGFGS